jgi:hypothetical protein
MFVSYCNVIGNYTVGSLFKKTTWIYFTLLQCIISWINVCRFTDHSPGSLDINVLFYVVIIFWLNANISEEHTVNIA